jgi:hypothetical protein
MIQWTKDFPRSEQPLALWRLLKAHYCYFDQPKFSFRFSFRKFFRPHLSWKLGYQSKLALMRDSYKNQPCVVVAGGASLSSCNFAQISKYPVIACNGSYKILNEHGIVPKFFCMEDREQVEKRRREWPAIKAEVKFTSLDNSYAIKPDGQTLFFCSSRHSHGDYFWSDEPRPFSRDFALVVYLGGTIVYVMLQLAYHLGCNPVYIAGLDHTYKCIIQELGIGRITHENRYLSVTEKNIHIIEKLHPNKGYFKTGELIALPFVDEQERSFAIARDVFQNANRSIINATPDSQLDVFPFGQIP